MANHNARRTKTKPRKMKMRLKKEPDCFVSHHGSPARGLFAVSSSVLALIDWSVPRSLNRGVPCAADGYVADCATLAICDKKNIGALRPRDADSCRSANTPRAKPPVGTGVEINHQPVKL